MADLDKPQAWGGGLAAFKKQAGAAAELILAIPLTLGEQYDFTFQVSSRKPTTGGTPATAFYQADLQVGVMSSGTLNPPADTWDVFPSISNAHGSATPTWTAAMNGNTLEVTANGGADWLHMIAVKSGDKCEFFVNNAGG